MLPTEVTRACDIFLGAIDGAAPGLVSGFYLHGSVALNDFQPAHSDVDFAAVMSRPADDEAIADLDRPRIEWLTAWCVLGISWMHHAVATGTLTSKSGAGEYAVIESIDAIPLS